ncbi:hypothetical protein OESDEN_00972 [Oesophagostomum dentatum]|uniref:Uncharacterized protein n=1 Tax=Oesophagostomum dentatum TaxID=61180 RepID=A0A0B1TT74_OESDE|nr:hypothetical protein OESDEN_00972 [Oesophagostomum dentatum]
MRSLFSYVECAWQVPKLIDELAFRMPKYPSVQAYLDLDHEASDFTALGCVILIRDKCIGTISQFNFVTSSYSAVRKGVNTVVNGLEGSPFVVKKKFPKEFWPTFKWGRKGYMQTRWKRLTERASAHTLEEPPGSVADGLLSPNSAAGPDTLRRTVSAVEFRRESLNEISSGCVLRIEKKRFDYFNQQKLLDDWKSYLEDDRETSSFDELYELPINFPPT